MHELIFEYRFALDLHVDEQRAIRRVLFRHPLGFPDTDVICFAQLPAPVQEELRDSPCDIVPGWTMGNDLFCWCETHHRWNRHGTAGINLAVEYRVPHHAHEKHLAIVVQGEAQSGSRLWKILSHYPHGASEYTPPPGGLVRLILPGDTLPDEMRVRVLHKPKDLFTWVSPFAGVRK